MTPLNVDLQSLIKQVEKDLPDARPLDKVTEAHVRASTMSDLGDQLVDHYVTAARAGGASWSQIGDALGVSKQAAQQRRGSGVFERFSPGARHVVVLSQEKARGLKCDYIGTEHVLLGLLAETDGIGAKAIAALTPSMDAVVEAVTNAIPVGSYAPRGHIPFTRLSKRALDEAVAVAGELGQQQIGSEHLLLGVLRVADGKAAELLAPFGIDFDRAKQTVLTLLGNQPG